MYGEFVERAMNGEIIGYKCRNCGMHTIKGVACPMCGSGELEKEVEPREGRVIACTKIHVAPPELSSEAPYTVALIELSSGMRIMGRVNGDVDMDKKVVFSGVKESALGLSVVFEARDH